MTGKLYDLKLIPLISALFLFAIEQLKLAILLIVIPGHSVFEKFKRWVTEHPGLAQGLVFGGFATIAVLGGVLTYIMEHAPDGTHVDKVSILLLGLVFPSAFSGLFITHVAAIWLTEKWKNEGREAIFVESFKMAAEMAQRRLDIVNSIGALTQHVFCTSHCNLFHKNGALNKPEEERVDAINRKFFHRLAELTVQSEPALMLLLHYSDDNAFAGEMGPRLDIYNEVCEVAKTELSLNHFSPCHLVQESVKDYFVIEEHVFKTIRKTPHSRGPTEYMHIQSKKIAGQYRQWLADLFYHGDGENNPTKFVEKHRFMKKYEAFRDPVTRERLKAQKSSV